MDKVFVRSVRCTLGIKCTTSNIIVLGECGVMCTIITLCFLNRLMCMDGDSLAKQVHDELQHLTDQGFDAWVSSIGKLANTYQLNLYMDPVKFRNECKHVVQSKFINQWAADTADITRNPILRTYRNIKLSFGTEPYIYLVQDKRYRHAKSRLRCSSHILHVEKGRYTRPRTPLHERLCYLCNCWRRTAFCDCLLVKSHRTNCIIWKGCWKISWIWHIGWYGKICVHTHIQRCSNSHLAWEIFVQIIYNQSIPMKWKHHVRGDLRVTVDVGDCHADSHQRLRWCSGCPTRYDIFPK